MSNRKDIAMKLHARRKRAASGRGWSLMLAAMLGLPGLGLSGCAVGPDYVRPTIDMPQTYKEAAAGADWQPAAAQAASSTADTSSAPAMGAWWMQFGDTQLNALVEQVVVDNQTVRMAAASYQQALASLSATQAGYWPDIDASLQAGRGAEAGKNAQNTRRVALTAAWEADLWGRIGRGVEADTALLAASAADLQAALLSAQAMLVQNYLQLRIVDAQRRLYERSLAEYQRALEITRNRYAAGVAGRSDVVQAEAQLHTTQAQSLDLDLQRTRLENAIAVLLGQPPAAFKLPAESLQLQVPSVPPGLPSQLLERRPDIAAAERRMAAANARIGVAQAAYFPALTLTGAAGYQHSQFAQLLSAPHRYWSLGPALALSLFDGGARSAAKAEALAAYERQVAEYRQTVLAAFQEVEDNLASLRLLAAEADVQQQAVDAAQELARLANNQYLAGLESYLHVVTAQTNALGAERNQLEIQGRRLQAATSLLKAIGGDWQTAKENLQTATAAE